MSRGALVVALLVAAPGIAAADANDLVLSRLAQPVDLGTGGTIFVPQNADFRSLASQLGVVLAPHMLTPADTLGFSGFQLTVDFSSTQIDSTAPYWRALQSSPDPRGTGGMAHGAGTQETVGFFVRKGMWFPVPAIEVGAGAVHLVNSRVWTGQFYTKLALHEGYHQFPLPSLAVRGGVSRMMNQNQLDLTIASLDATVSKHFGIGGTWRFDPYVGFNLLMIVPRSEVIDPTPNVDSLVMGNEMDATNSFVFKDQNNIYRNRFLVGMKFQYYIVQLTVEATFATAGTSIDDRPGVTDTCAPMSMTTNCDAKDTAAGQRTFSFSLGLDF
ncbi:MAG: hypothetical protein KIT31_13130 [Deltaproteobacteria bacterium]|nr:hypothetical protein [Deltaproteobacteria bacterium]